MKEPIKFLIALIASTMFLNVDAFESTYLECTDDKDVTIFGFEMSLKNRIENATEDTSYEVITGYIAQKGINEFEKRKIYKEDRIGSGEAYVNDEWFIHARQKRISETAVMSPITDVLYYINRVNGNAFSCIGSSLDFLRTPPRSCNKKTLIGNCKKINKTRAKQISKDLNPPKKKPKVLF